MKTDWIYGLSASGKTTHGLKLVQEGCNRILLDADALRAGVCADLGHSRCDRIWNVTRIAHLAKLLMDQGYDVVVCAITPYQAQRDIVNRILKDRVQWHFMSTPIDVCRERDRKGIYGNLSMVPGETDVFDEPREKGQICVYTDAPLP